MADLRPTSNVPPEASGKAAGGKRARPARPARDVGGNGLWDRPQLLNLISDVLLVFGAAGWATPRWPLFRACPCIRCGRSW